MCIGDPHVITLDGLLYSFNGLGEFILIRNSEFELQARTKKVIRAGVPQLATGFVGFSAKQKLPLSDRVEFMLNDVTNSIGMYFPFYRQLNLCNEELTIVQSQGPPRNDYKGVNDLEFCTMQI